MPVPDYTLLSKRTGELNIPIRRFRKSEQPELPDDSTTRLTLDSTGLKTCGEGEWLREKHNTKTRREWRKAHIGIMEDGDIVAASLTTNRIHDADEASNLLGQIATKVEMFLGDGAYDQDPLHDELETRFPEIKIITPPRMQYFQVT